MKNIFLISITVVLLLVPSLVSAQDTDVNSRGKRISVLAPGEVVNKDYFTTGEVVEISGTVNGDVYVAGGQVFIDGIINGDLLVAGGDVTVSGQISQNIRAAGGQITITGSIGRNTTLVGGNIELTDAAMLGGNLVVAGGNVTVSSPVADDIRAGVGNLTISNKIGGNVEAGVGTMRLTSKASVDGDITYISEEVASIAESASISGTLNHKEMPQFTKSVNRNDMKGFMSGFSLFSKIISFISSLVLGLIIIKLLPNYASSAAEIIRKEFLRSLGIGTVALILIPLTAVFLLVTIFALPLGLLLGIVFIIYLYLARVFAMIAIGQKVTKLLAVKEESLNWIFIAGLIIYFLLSLIPIVGGFIKMFILIAGLGAAITNDRRTLAKAQKAKIV